MTEQEANEDNVDEYVDEEEKLGKVFDEFMQRQEQVSTLKKVLKELSRCLPLPHDVVKYAIRPYFADWDVWGSLVSVAVDPEPEWYFQPYDHVPCLVNDLWMYPTSNELEWYESMHADEVIEQHGGHREVSVRMMWVSLTEFKDRWLSTRRTLTERLFEKRFQRVIHSWSVLHLLLVPEWAETDWGWAMNDYKWTYTVNGRAGRSEFCLRDLKRHAQPVMWAELVAEDHEPTYEVVWRLESVNRDCEDGKDDGEDGGEVVYQTQPYVIRNERYTASLCSVA